MPHLMDRIKSAGHARLKGASWQHPAVQRVLPFIDKADVSVRHRLGLDELPAYSLRIRSNGVDGQFGGVRFFRLGRTIGKSLETYAGLDATSEVLEIGCGVGRVALALLDKYPALRYTGLDVDKPSVDACLHNSRLTGAGFRFVLADVATELYNPTGGVSAESYRLPFPSDSMDVVYLISVFTHMLPAECENYAQEIMRVLRAGGRCALTTLLVDRGANVPASDWTVDGDLYSRYPATPRKMIGHATDSLTRWFGVVPDVIIGGTWRGATDDGFACQHQFSQDMLVFKKNAEPS